MIFLVDYDRSKGKLALFKQFADSQQRQAQDERLALEIKFLKEKIDHEVVLLEAADEAALRKTHRRYFESIRDIVGATPH